METDHYREGKRPRGRPKRRRDDNIRIYFIRKLCSLFMWLRIMSS